MLRYCARPPFALNRLRALDPEHLLYENTQQCPCGNGPQLLTPLGTGHHPSAVPAHPPPLRYWRERLLTGTFGGELDGLKLADGARVRRGRTGTSRTDGQLHSARGHPRLIDAHAASTFPKPSLGDRRLPATRRADFACPRRDVLWLQSRDGSEIFESASAAGWISDLSTAKSPSATMPTSRFS